MSVAPRTWWGRGLLVAFGMLVPPVVVEGGAALWEVVAYGALSVDGRPVGLYLPPRPGRGPALRPGARLRGLVHDVRVNEHGFRGPELAAEFPAEGLRVWCLGGSTTFDIYAPDDARTWPAQLGGALAPKLAPRAVEVINAGVPGEVALGNADALRAKGPALQPDYVVLYLGPNDLRDIAATGDGRPPRVGTRPATLRSVRMFVAWRLSRGDGPAGLPDRRPDARARARMRERLGQIVDVASSIGARPVLTAHALRVAPGATGESLRLAAAELPALLDVAPEAVLDWFDAWNDEARALAAARGLPYADVRAAVGDASANWGDATHFRAPGSVLAARAVFDAIVADLPAR